MVVEFAAAESAPTALATDPLVKELLRKLEERDALVADLQQRVKALERQVAIIAADQAPSPAEPSVAARPVSSAPPFTQPAQPKPAKKPPTEGSGVAQTGPGQFEVDEQAAERALEQTLVTTGNLLLPLGQAEIQPGVTYTRRELNAPILFQEGESQNVVTRDIRRNILDGDLSLRFGLPFDSQLELNFPYRYVDQKNVTRLVLLH